MSFFNSLPPLSGSLPSDHVRKSIPPGKAGTAATIREMQKFVEKNKQKIKADQSSENKAKTEKKAKLVVEQGENK